MHMPKGAGGNPAFDEFIEDLLMAARMLGGHWTNYRLRDQTWTGTLLETLRILEKYLPNNFFRPESLAVRLNTSERSSGITYEELVIVNSLDVSLIRCNCAIRDLDQHA